MELKTDRLILREWKESDKEPFYKLNSDPQVTEFLGKKLTREQSDNFILKIEEHFQEHGFGLWAVEVKESGAFIGFTGLSIPKFDTHFTPCVEIGWRLAAEYWGKGYATEAAERSLQHGFEELSLDEIVSFTVPENIRSRRVMEKIRLKHDSREDFDHPNLPEGHKLRHHVLYRLKKIDY